MIKLTDRQKEVFEKIDSSATDSQWRDWKWQIRHQVRDIETFENLLGVVFEEDERRQLAETVSRFPIAITPYYLSLIDTDEISGDPIFKQAFPSPDELITFNPKWRPPGRRQGQSRPGITHRYPDRGSSCQ